MRITRRATRFIVIALCVLAAAEALTFGWNFFAPRRRPKPNDAQIAQRLEAHVRKLSEEIGERDLDNYANLAQAADYITRQLESYGYKAQSQEYILQGKKVRNIIVRKDGLASTDEVVIVGAHYDTVATPGADDNASGVATVLELARALRDKPSARSIEFCFFTNEEDPFFKTELMGSRVFIRKAKMESKDIMAAVVFDMTGYYTDKINSQRYFPLMTGLFLPNRGNFIAVISNFWSSDTSDLLVESFQRNSRFPIVLLASDFEPTVDSSDHWAFWEGGYPAVMISDTNFLRNNRYHTSADMPDTLDFESMACVVEGFSASLLDLTDYEE